MKTMKLRSSFCATLMLAAMTLGANACACVQDCCRPRSDEKSGQPVVGHVGADIISELTVFTPANPAYENQHMHFKLGAGKEGEFYYSGGRICAGVPDLTQSERDLLFQAMVHQLQVDLAYVATRHAGEDYRCVAHFVSRPRS